MFDWNKDGQSDHVEIIKTAENDLVKTIEGNSNDECKERSYMVTSDFIMGYGYILKNINLYKIMYTSFYIIDNNKSIC